MGSVSEVFVALAFADGKVTVPRRVPEVLQIEKGDYVRVTITEVLKWKQEREGRKGGRRRQF